MKTIEETHPSFNKTWKLSSDLDGYVEVPTMNLVNALQEHTIDKAVLKKVIDRICLQTGAEITAKHLYIELELEEKDD